MTTPATTISRPTSTTDQSDDSSQVAAAVAPLGGSWWVRDAAPSDDPDAPWQNRGLCTGLAALFTHDVHTEEQETFMRGECARCPVLDQCAKLARTAPVAGFLAGQPDRERTGTPAAAAWHADAVGDALGRQVTAVDTHAELRKLGAGTARARAEMVVRLLGEARTRADIAAELGYTKRSINRLIRDARTRYGLLPAGPAAAGREFGYAS